MSRARVLTRRLPRRPEVPAAESLGIEADGITFDRGGRTLLDDVGVAIRGGELVALAGPNGAGKSTLLGVLAGDLEPDGGAVRLDGRPLADWSSTERAMRRAVMAGGGFRTGQIIGATDSQAGQSVVQPYTPGNVIASLYRHLEIDTTITIPDHNLRPMYVLDEREIVREL